jgi:hypothetical protein
MNAFLSVFVDNYGLKNFSIYTGKRRRATTCSSF